MVINQLTIIGLGVIGTSIAKAIYHTDFCETVVGFDENQHKGESTLKTNIISSYKNDLPSAVKEADLVIITTPFCQYQEIFSKLAKHIKSTAIITDTSSIKLPVIKLAEKLLAEQYRNFVPVHPFIGCREQQTHPTAELFANKPVILTPTDKTDSQSIAVVKRLWQKTGGEVELMSAAMNDEILATISHLPQLLASTFINSLNNKNQIFKYINYGFKDFIHMATNDPTIWRDICLANRQAILKELAYFEANLKSLKKFLESENEQSLLEHFNNARSLRESM